MKPTNPPSVDMYIANAPEQSIPHLMELREIVLEAAPKATELISYNMPAIKMEKIVVYYAGYKKHIGFYPMPSVIKAFAEELTGYKTSTGGIQFPLDKKLPKTLIKKMIKHRLKEMNV